MTNGCTPAPTCSPTNCATGCCDSAGECQVDNAQACGTGGNSCGACGFGQTCTSGLCLGGSGSGGGVGSIGGGVGSTGGGVGSTGGGVGSTGGGVGSTGGGVGSTGGGVGSTGGGDGSTGGGVGVTGGGVGSTGGGVGSTGGGVGSTGGGVGVTGGGVGSTGGGVGSTGGGVGVTGGGVGSTGGGVGVTGGGVGSTGGGVGVTGGGVGVTGGGVGSTGGGVGTCAAIQLVHEAYPSQTTVEDSLAFFQMNNGNAIYGALLGSNTGQPAPLYDLIQVSVASNPSTQTVDFANVATQSVMSIVVFEDSYNCPSTGGCTSSSATSVPFLATSGTLTLNQGSLPYNRPFVGTFTNLRLVQVDPQTGTPVSGGRCLNLATGGVSVPAPATAPAGWTCPGVPDAGALYDDGACHCGCSAPAGDGGVLYDPDCAANEVTACNVGWRCDLTYYGAADGCDCGCGAIDPDCTSNTVSACQWCDACGQTMSTQSCTQFISATDIRKCIDGGTP